MYLNSNVCTYLLNLFIILTYLLYCIVILFYITKTSIDRKINKQQKQNLMGKIRIYLDQKDVLLIKSSNFSIPKSFSMSVVRNIW